MKNKIYEISFWARQDRGEEVSDKILSLIKEFDFELIKKMPLKTKEMAYPIMKEKIGDFGTIYFYGTQEKIENFKNRIKKIENILRFIVLKRKILKGITDENIKLKSEAIINES